MKATPALTVDFRERLLADLLAILPAAVVDASKAWAAARLGYLELTAEMESRGNEPLMLFIVRTINPEFLFTEEEEATYRGCGKDRLRSLKSDSLLPRILAAGNQVNR